MALKVSIEEVKCTGRGIWEVAIDPSELRRLGACQNAYGNVSVLLLTESVYLEHEGRLEFEPSAARLLNVGSTSETVVISSIIRKSFNGSENSKAIGERPETYGTGDKLFLRDLEPRCPDMLPVGEKLLSDIRREFAGDLKFHERSGRFVESPDSFWTVKIQPRDRSLRITVRGTAEKFVGVQGSMLLQPDRPGYSTFKVINIGDVPAAVSVIRQAARK